MGREDPRLTVLRRVCGRGVRQWMWEVAGAPHTYVNWAQTKAQAFRNARLFIRKNQDLVFGG